MGALPPEKIPVEDKRRMVGEMEVEAGVHVDEVGWADQPRLAEIGPLREEGGIV